MTVFLVRALSEHPEVIHRPLLDAAEAKDRLRAWSPLYANYLPTSGETDADESLRETLGSGRLRLIWEERGAPNAASREGLQALRSFRREQSLRIALREIAGIAAWDVTARELSDLADFCLQTVFSALYQNWEEKLGTPWDEANDRPASIVILGFGKLGGQELNFCSDVDLVFAYDGAGHCRKGEKVTSRSNVEFYQRLCGDFARLIGERTAAGEFLYNMDLRLRPEGDSGPLVPSLTALENYYAVAGQAWERLALIRARPVAGDLSLGHELFEALHAFRYPRHAPPSLLDEVAALKNRTEQEVVGEEQLELDIKRGWGGIREVEFLCQSLQLLHGGRYPFLQTGRVPEALEQLGRYERLDESAAQDLARSYGLLRLVENRLQMREEEQTHRLPPKNSHDRTLLAATFGLGRDDFEEQLHAARERIRGQYAALFRGNEQEDEALQAWISFFSGKPAPKLVEERLQGWFNNPSEIIRERLTKLVVGGSFQGIRRDGIQGFLALSESFDRTLPKLAHPVQTLERIQRFVERYGASRVFLKTCQDNPRFFEALALLFDRSVFTFELLRAHPEIMEELFRGPVSRQKSVAEHRDEMSHGPQGEAFPSWLWLYVKAEQVRISTAEVFGTLSFAEVERSLSNLGDAALLEALSRVGATDRLAIVALGKSGSQELSYGSDLDLIVLAEDANEAETMRLLTQWQRILEYKNRGLGPTLELDFRLRPHGNDGPTLVTLPALRAYHEGPAGAQSWEKLILTRARPVGGRTDLCEAFEQWRQKLLFSQPLSPEEAQEVWHLRRRAEKEKGQADPPVAAIKAGIGGLMDLDTLAQLLLARFGHECPSIRHRDIPSILRSLREAGYIPTSEGPFLEEQYVRLRQLEHILRRDTQQPETVLPTDEDRRHTMATMMDLSSFAEVIQQREQSAPRIRKVVLALLRESFKVTF